MALAGAGLGVFIVGVILSGTYEHVSSSPIVVQDCMSKSRYREGKEIMKYAQGEVSFEF